MDAANSKQGRLIFVVFSIFLQILNALWLISGNTETQIHHSSYPRHTRGFNAGSY